MVRMFYFNFENGKKGIENFGIFGIFNIFQIISNLLYSLKFTKIWILKIIPMFKLFIYL